MKKITRCISFVLLCLITLAPALPAETVTINFQNVFESYQELKVEDQKLREEVAAFQQAQQAKAQALQAKQQAFSEMRNRAAQPNVTVAEREEMIQQATEQLEAMNAEEQALRQERAQFQKDLEAKGLRLRREIVDKVNARVAEIAKDQNWDLVVDSSAKGSNGLSIVPFVAKSLDKTDFVIREMNATPAAASADTE